MKTPNSMTAMKVPFKLCVVHSDWADVALNFFSPLVTPPFSGEVNSLSYLYHSLKV